MKEEILKILKDNTGSFVSGESLSSILGVTRASVWKHINQLKAEGYIFVSSSKKGYKLLSSPDILTESELSSFITAKTIGKRIVHYDSIDSTNTKAKELAGIGAEEGTVVISEEQVSGKGRLGRQWISPKYKGIWMSIILRPDVNPVFASKVTLIGAAAVHRALSETGISSFIKWPNDIVLNSKKVCGILTEMSAELNKIHYLVMGIGVNVNTENSEFPEELQSVATSLKVENSRNIDRRLLAASILNNFEDLYQEFRTNGSIVNSVAVCRENSILLGKEIRIINGNTEFKAKALDIDNEGQLIIEHGNGAREAVFSGEVSARGLYGYV